MGIYSKTCCALAAALSLSASQTAFAAASASAAFGARLNLNANVQVIGLGADTAVLARTPDVQASGSSSYGPLQQSVLNAQASLFTTTVFSAGVLFGRTEYVSATPLTTSKGAAENVDVNLQITSLLPLLRLRADSIEGNARVSGVCGVLEASGYSELVGARVTALNGNVLNLPVNPPPNFTVDLGVLGITGVTLVLNEQVQSGNGFSRSISVNALHLDVSANALLASLAGDIVIGHAEASRSCAAGDGPNLRGSKSMTPNPGTVGQPLTFQLGVVNNGNQTATNVQMIDTLDASFTIQSFVAANGGSCSRSGQTVTCTYASLPPGASVGATIVVIPTQPGNFSNGLNTGFDGPDGDPGDDDPVIPVVIVTPTLTADFALGMSAAPSPATVGLPLSYTITVTNTGPDGAGASVSDDLPAGATLQSASASDGGSCNSSNPVSCSWSSIPNGGVRTMTVTVVPNQVGTLSNTATVTAGSGAVDPDPSDNSATVQTPVIPAPIVADLSISKTASPSPVIVGQSLTYTLTVTNSGPDAAAGQVSDTLPSGVNFVSSSASDGGNCSGTGTVSCNWTSIPSGATRTATIIVTPTQTGTVVNTAVVATGGGAGDPDPSDNSASVSTQVNPAPIVADFSISKTATPNPATVGQPLTYTLTVSNAGPDTASASISDALPAQVNLSTLSASNGGSCSGTSTVQCSWTNIPAGATRTATIVVVPTLAGSVSNTAVVGHTGGGSDPDPSDDQSTVVVTVEPAAVVADFSIVKTASPNPATVGQPLTYTLTVTNSGPDAAGAQVTDTLASSVSFTSASASNGGSCSGTSTVTCSWSSIPSGAVRTATIVVVPGQAGTLSNTASVAPTGGAGDPDPSDDTSTTSTPVTPAPIVADFSVVKTANPNPATVGQALTYTLTVTNNGPDAAGASVTDQLPASVSLTSSSASNGGNCTGGATVVCTWTSIPSGAVRTATIVVVPSQAGTVVNTAVVAHTGGGNDPDPTDDTSTTSTPVNPAPILADLTMAMSGNPNPAFINGTLTYLITVGNTGPSAAGANVSDVLPSSVTFVSASASDGGVCSGTTTVNCNWSTVPVGGTRTVTLVVTPTQPGTVSNTATVSPTGGVSDPDPSDNSATVNTNVQGVVEINADMGVTGTVAPSPGTVGQPLTYTLTVSNAGPSAAGAQLSDSLPASFTFTSATASDGGSCTHNSGLVTCTWATFPSGGTRTTTLVVVPTVAGNLSNTATVTAQGAQDPNPANNSTTTSVTVNGPPPASADLGVQISAAPNPVQVGSDLVYTMTISNAGPDASAVRLTDELPASFTLQSATASNGGNCSGTSTVTCTWASMASGQTRTATLTVRPTQAGAISNSASVASTDGATDPNPANNSASTSVQVNAVPPRADLGVTLSANPQPATVGQPLSLTIDISNTGPDASGVSLSDLLPASFVIRTVSASAGGSCNSSSNLSCSWASVASGGNVSVLVSVTPGTAGSFPNTATVATTGGVTDPSPGNNSATQSIQVNSVPPPPSANLRTVVRALPATVTLGDPLVLQVEVFNNGPDAAAITVSQSLNSGLELLEVVPGNGGTCTQANCSFPLTASGSSVRVDLRVSPNRTGSIVHLASATPLAPANDPDLSDNTGTATILVNAPNTPLTADLAAEKIAFPADPVVGSPVDYLLTVRNLGPDKAVGPIVLTDDLPPALRLLSITSQDGGVCSIDGSRVRCTFDGLGAGKSATASLLVLANVAGVQRNSLTVVHPNTDPNPDNNRDAMDVEVRADSGFLADGSQCHVTRKLTSHAIGDFTAVGELRYGGADAVIADQPQGQHMVYNQSLDWSSEKIAVAGDSTGTSARLLDVSHDGQLSLVRSNRDLANNNLPLASAETFLVDTDTQAAERLPAEISTAAWPTIDGNGERVVYLLATGNGEVQMKLYDNATNSVRTVRTFSGEAAQFVALRTTADGGEAAFTARINPVGENADGSVEVFRIDLMNGTVRQVTAGVGASYELGGFDGTGDRLVWISNGQVQVHDVLAGTLTVTRDNSAKTTPQLTHNGQKVVYLATSGTVPGSYELTSAAVVGQAAPIVLTRFNQAANGGQDKLLSNDGSGQTFLVASRRALMGGQPDGMEHTFLVDCDAIRSGAWYNPERSGHGFAIQRSADGLAVLWYTYNEDGTPTWYIASGPRRGKSWQSDLLDVRYNHADGSRTITTVGTLALSFADAHNAVAQWTINGHTLFERIQFLEFDADAPVRDDTGVYYDPNNPGWGLSVSEQGGIRFMLAYFYDQQGRPVWVEGQTEVEADTDSAARAYHGPGLCPTAGCSPSAPPPINRTVGRWEVDPHAYGEVDISTEFIDTQALKPLQWVRATTAFKPLTPLSP